MKVAMLIVMFLFIGAFFIVSQNNLALNSSENVDKFVSDYANWIGNIVKNIGSSAGYVIKLEWLPRSEPEG